MRPGKISRALLGMGAVVALTAIATPAAAPAPARACAIAWPMNEVVGMGAEEALIVWDAPRRMEHFVRRAAFESAGDDFGFLVPTPSRPELAEADDGVFARLASATQPAVEHETSWFVSTCCLSTFGTVLMTRGGEMGPLAVSAVPPPVTLLGEQRVAGLDAAILAATDAEALARWLDEHGYVTRPSLASWLEPYVARGWIITAFKIAKAEGATGAQVGTRALRMSFQTDRPYYPYREPDDATIQPGRELRVFVVAASRLTGTMEDGTAWTGDLRYARPFSTTARGAASLLANAVPDEAVRPDLWLNDFVDRHERRPPGGDLFFGPASNRSEIVPPPVVITDEAPLPLPIEPLLIGIGIWLWMRRRRQRRLAAQRAGGSDGQSGGSGSTSRT